LLDRFGCNPELAQAPEVEAAMVVFVLPLAELLGELGRGPEDHTAVELVFVRSMATLDLAVDLGATPRDLAVDHPKIPPGAR
jgi:hypothetical protein